MSYSIKSTLFCVFIYFIFIYAKFPCNPESFRFLPIPYNIKPKETYTVQVTNYEEIGCAIHASYRWFSYHVVHRKFYKDLTANVLKITRITKSTINQVSFASIYSDMNLYGEEVAVKVHLIPRPTHFPSYRVRYFRINDEEYNLRIEGGTYTEHTIGKGSLWLNATVKRESRQPMPSNYSVEWSCSPEFKRNIAVTSLMNLQILETELKSNQIYRCKVTLSLTLPKKRTISAYQDVKVIAMKYRPFFDIICISNCPIGNAYKETKIRCVCINNCFGRIAWTVDPYDANVQKSLEISESNHSTVSIPPATFQHGSFWNILAVLGDVTNVFTIVFEIPKIELSVECIKNCFDYTKEILFRAKCSGFCEGVTYRWEAVPVPKVWTWSYLYSENNSIFSFEPGRFFPGLGAHLRVYFFNYSASTKFVT